MYVDDFLKGLRKILLLLCQQKTETENLLGIAPNQKSLVGLNLRLNRLWRPERDRITYDRFIPFKKY